METGMAQGIKRQERCERRVGLVHPALMRAMSFPHVEIPSMMGSCRPLTVAVIVPSGDGDPRHLRMPNSTILLWWRIAHTLSSFPMNGPSQSNKVSGQYVMRHEEWRASADNLFDWWFNNG